MKRIIPTIIVVALIGVTAPTTAEPDEPAETVGASITFRAPGAATADAAASGPGAHEPESSEGATAYTCSSTMHDVYVPSGSAYCNTGTHTRGTQPVLMHIHNVSDALSGMLEHVLSHDGGEVRFQCSWDAGAWQGCHVGSAVWPPAGAVFCHEMWAHAGPPPGGYLPNVAPCDTTVQSDGLVLTANAPPGGSGMASGTWQMTLTY